MKTITSLEGVTRAIRTSQYLIRSYTEDKVKYENMKNKINNEILPKLRLTINELDDAKANLTKNYDGQGAKERSNNILSEVKNIKTIINTLNNVIKSIDKKLIDINNGIKTEKYNIEQYEKMQLDNFGVGHKII